MKRLPTRERLLEIINILQQETDDENQVGLQDIEQKLKHIYGDGAAVKREVLREDLSAIDAYNMSVTRNHGSHGKNLYSHQERLFELYELRMLMDAVLSARFMTTKDAQRLIDKIRHLTSEPQREKLQHHLYVDETVRNDSDLMKYDVNSLHIAMSDSKKVEFQYGHYNNDIVFTLRRDGMFYPVKPYALTWDNGFYYLIGEFELTNEIRHYRVDRMRHVRVKDETFKRPDFNVSEYMKTAFNMFAGKEADIEIQFSSNLLNIMIDRFGRDSNYEKVDEETFVIKTKAAISDGLVHWLLARGGEVKVLSPDDLIDRMKEAIMQLYEVYY
ncbi:helix-turn-helix transcriptional regulator [Tuberibacillus sp. Marseille-P3662]|uniref:helix-turn-helix transcriptional regulator n=1 Tax=Tuberibacillus sp. Marseille-P3662 TaxID=1965358 RepID=UPI000A1CB60F|nr:WYL domain-containing protein [Tuberibacillus sp. Marseille-P3662]